MVDLANPNLVGRKLTVDDDGNLVMDVNKRILLSTDQDTATDERLIELKYTTDTAKAIIAYVDQNDNPVVWLQAHDYLSAGNRHRHFSVESAMADGTLTTRFQVPYGTDTVDVEVNNANFVVGGTGELTVSSGNANINGDVLINEGNMRVNSTGTATLEVDRGGTSNYANLSFRSGGTEKFAVGLRAGDSHLHIRNSGVTKIRVRDGASGSIELGTGLDLQGNVIDGRAVRTLVGSGSLGTDDEWLLVDTSGGNASIALPQPASSQSFRLKKTTTDTNTITLTRVGTETIEGAASGHTLTGSGGTDLPSYALVYDQPNNAWWVAR